MPSVAVEDHIFQTGGHRKEQCGNFVMILPINSGYESFWGEPDRSKRPFIMSCQDNPTTQERSNGGVKSAPWRPSLSIPIYKTEPTDWTRLKNQGGYWEVAEFTGGATTQRVPEEFTRDQSSMKSDDEELLESYTPRQRQLYKSLDLPEDVTLEPLTAVPSIEAEFLQGLSPDVRHHIVKSMFKQFVVELTRGAYFTQLTSQRDYITLYCQLMESLDGLMLDQNSGRRIEFPLTGRRCVRGCFIMFILTLRYSKNLFVSSPSSTIVRCGWRSR